MQLSEYVNAITRANVEYKIDESLSNYCAYRTGGPAKIMVFPKSHEQLCACTKTDIPIEVIGFGTNLLCSDKGFNGIVINSCKMSKITVSGACIRAECGAKLSEVREIAEINCLGGLEFTDGIPASVGGGVCMNAGCFTKSLSEYVAYVVTDKAVYNNQSCDFGYRNSIFCKKKGEIISSVCFVLKPSESDIIQSKREKFKKLRKNSQPHGKSCGSVFLNDGYFAGKIIDTAGLKGYSIGGAKVSEKHANFILNTGNSSQDIYDLIKFIKNKVYQTQNVKLKEEIKYIGIFDD
ncbi:MAG: UDP-N-acetylmuramate dehydrogenase [Clostridia bacterium]|nr:UDP-N-acetylmuramate dehydrogenase [Clostridia bacterium]